MPDLDPNIIRVAAASLTDTASTYTNTGNNIDLSAPGCTGNIPYPPNTYVGSQCGTSIAAAYVSGVAGLLLSLNPNLSPADVTRILKSSTDNIGVGPAYGTGRLNAYRALT